jgi:flagellar export protein FliJ
MARFRFHLDRVLEWYRKEFQIESSRLAVCVTLCHENQQRLERLRAELVATERAVIEQPSLTARDLAALTPYRLRVKQEEINLLTEGRKLEAALAVQRDKYQAADRRVRLMEKLRERRQAEHQAEESRQLEEAASESFLAGFARR